MAVPISSAATAHVKVTLVLGASVTSVVGEVSVNSRTVPTPLPETTVLAKGIVDAVVPLFVIVIDKMVVELGAIEELANETDIPSDDTTPVKPLKEAAVILSIDPVTVTVPRFAVNTEAA